MEWVGGVRKRGSNTIEGYRVELDTATAMLGGVAYHGRR